MEFLDPETLFPDFGDFDPCTGSTEEKNNINTNFLGRIPGGRSPGKEPFSQTQRVYARPFFTIKHGIPNMNFSEHKLLAAPRLAFQKVHAKKFMFVFFRSLSISALSDFVPLILVFLRKPLRGPPTHRIPKPPSNKKINSQNPKIFENPLE